MKIKQDGMLKLCGTQKMDVVEQPPRGKGKDYVAQTQDGNSVLKWRVYEDERVNTITLLVPAAQVGRIANRRNAFIMAALIKSAAPNWKEGFAWLVASLRTLHVATSDRLTHVEPAAVISIDRLVHGKIRLMLSGK